MDDKTLRKLNRRELLELLLEQTKRNDTLEAELKSARAELAERRLNIEKSGDLAQASLAISKIFLDAQKAADIYVENRKARADEEVQAAVDAAVAEAVEEAVKTAKEEAKAETQAEMEAMVKAANEEAAKAKEEAAAAMAEAEATVKEAEKSAAETEIAVKEAEKAAAEAEAAVKEAEKVAAEAQAAAETAEHEVTMEVVDITEAVEHAPEPDMKGQADE